MKLITLQIAMISFSGTLILGSGCSKITKWREANKKEKKPETSEQLSFVKPVSGPFEDAMEWKGKIQSLKSISIQASESLKVDKVLVTTNQLVKKGQILLETDTTDQKQKVDGLNSQLRSQNLQLEGAKLRLDRAQSLYERKIRLAKQGVIALSEKEQAETGYREAETGLKSKKLEIDKMKSELSQATLGLKSRTFRSPIDGVVAFVIPNEKGGQISGGMQIAVISDPADQGIQVQIDESFINRLKVGQAVDIKIDALGGKVFPGEIVFKSLQPSQGSTYGMQVFEVRAKMKTMPPQIRLGFDTVMRVTFSKKASTLVIPRSALAKMDGQFYVKRSTSGRSVPDVQKVTLGIQTTKEVEILSGISEKDFIALGSK